MGILQKIFSNGSSVNPKIRKACNSDIFENIVKVINNDRAKYDAAVGYLKEKGNLSMMLRIMTLPVAAPNEIMFALMALEPSDAPKINKLCKDGLNPVLHFSMFKGMEILIRVIAHADADLDVVGAKGHTPLTIACENGLPSTVKMLINNGARAFDKCDESGWAPLHYACHLGNIEMVEALINAGANVNVMSADKLMPIHLALSTMQAARKSPIAPNGLPWSEKGAMMCVLHLADHGADLNYVCPYGFSGRSFLKR